MFARYSRSGLILMAAPLYAGPLVAGWSLLPWQTGAVLAGIFCLMQLLGGKGGGGRPEMAQAGGPDASKGEEALEAIRGVLAG